MKSSLLDFNHRFNSSLFSRAHSLIDNGDWYFNTMAPIILLAIPAVLIPHCLTLFFLAVFYGIVAMLIETFFSNYAAYKLQHMLTAVARERFSDFNREEVVAYTLLSTLTLHSNKLYCIRIESKQFQQKFEQFNSLHIYNREEAIAYTLLATIIVQSEKLTVASVIDEEFLHSYSELLRQLPSVAYDKRVFPKHSSIEHALSRAYEVEIIASTLEYLNCKAERLLAPFDCPKRIDTCNYFYKLYQPYMNGYLKQQFNDYLKLQNSLVKIVGVPAT